MMKQNKYRSFIISSPAGQKTKFHGWPAAIILCFCTGVTALAQSPGKSDSERLRELEGIVQQLREQNQSLQQRVGEL